MISEI